MRNQVYFLQNFITKNIVKNNNFSKLVHKTEKLILLKKLKVGKMDRNVRILL